METDSLYQTVLQNADGTTDAHWCPTLAGVKLWLSMTDHEGASDPSVTFNGKPVAPWEYGYEYQ